MKTQEGEVCTDGRCSDRVTEQGMRTRHYQEGAVRWEGGARREGGARQEAGPDRREVPDSREEQKGRKGPDRRKSQTGGGARQNSKEGPEWGGRAELDSPFLVGGNMFLSVKLSRLWYFVTVSLVN